MTDALKPCPFCDGPTAIKWVDGKPWFFPACTQCGARGLTYVASHGATEDEAIAAWNTRAPAALEPQSVDDAMVERMARAHDKEEAAQRGEPSPWDDPTIDAAWIAERITCMRAALQAAKEPSHD